MTARLPLLLLATTFALALTGCPSDDDDDTNVDTGVADTGVKDTGDTVDTGVDSGTPDMGTPDTGVDAGPGDPQAIRFIHTNDEGSHMLGVGPNVDDFPLSMDENIKGGIHRRAQVILDLKAEALAAREGAVVVNAGDVAMGSLFHLANLFASQTGSPDFIVMEQIGYDVVTLGNHEFDFGVSTLDTMIRFGGFDIGTMTPQMFPKPIVASNIRFSMSSPDDDGLEALWSEAGGQDRPIQRVHIQDFRDVTVGFVGYMGVDAALVAPFKSPIRFSVAVDDTASCTNDGQCPGSVCVPSAEDPTNNNGNCALDPSGADAASAMQALIADVASAVQDLRDQDVDIVVAVAHAGVSERELAMLEAMGDPPSAAMVSEDILVAVGVEAALGGTPGIDLIIGGHSHSALAEPIEVEHTGRSTFIVQAGGDGEFVGSIRMERPDEVSPWTVDLAETGLTEVNGLVTPNSLGPILELVLNTVINDLIDGLEGTPIAQPGDGLIFPGEQCDDTLLPNNGNCLNLVPGADGGTLACAANRQLDISGCTFPVGKNVCGNDTREIEEQCDGTDLPQDCNAFGYDGGNIGCHPNCAYDFSGCTPIFPSLLESALNFQWTGPRIVDDGNTIGDLFFYVLGQATYDVGGTNPHAESNLSNLVADSTRWSINAFDNQAATAPVELVVVANGVVRDDLLMGNTGNLTMADLFRVLPLGVSALENTPGYPVTDFYLEPAEVKAALEVGVSVGAQTNSFWLSISGARVEYDPSLSPFDPMDPNNTGRITKIELIDATAADDPAADLTATYETVPLYDASLGTPFPDPTRLVKVAASLYVTLYAEAFGICPRDLNGNQDPLCATCTNDTECTEPGTFCDVGAMQCTGGPPVAFFNRTLVPTGQAGFFQELKEVLGLNSYIRQLPNGGTLPANYDGAVPRRMCCVGTACAADGSQTCP